jgi:para-aminobenzoate synthetase/4-amino-4-deoxychorismate lyase
VLLAVDDDPVDPRETSLYHKTSVREPYDRRREQRPDVDVIMVNTSGELTEGHPGLPGAEARRAVVDPSTGIRVPPRVERARLLEVGRLQERVLHLADLDRAEGMAVVSSLRGSCAAELTAVGCGVAPARGRPGPARPCRRVGSRCGCDCRTAGQLW